MLSQQKSALITQLKQNTIHVTTASPSFLLHELHHSKRKIDVDMVLAIPLKVTLPSPSIFFVRLVLKFTATVYYSPTVVRQRHG